MTMTREEIRRAALAIHELRKFKNRSAGCKKKMERGFNTGFDFDPRSRTVYGPGQAGENSIGAVDRMFAAYERTGYLPKGSWS